VSNGIKSLIGPCRAFPRFITRVSWWQVLAVAWNTKSDTLPYVFLMDNDDNDDNITF
jgi:hypothetical protein